MLTKALNSQMGIIGEIGEKFTSVFETNDSEYEKINNLSHLSDSELKSFLKDVLEGNREFDWKDFNQKIFELKKTPVVIDKFLDLPISKYAIALHGTLVPLQDNTPNDDSKEIKTLDYKVIISSNLLSEIKKNKKMGVYIKNNYLICYGLKNSKGNMYVWVFNESEVIKKVLQHIFDKMKLVINDYNSKTKTIDDFFGSIKKEEVVEEIIERKIEVKENKLFFENDNTDDLI